MGLIPDEIDAHHKQKREDFSRKRKLPLSKLIVFILSITVSGKNKGVDSKSGEFFRNARRSGLWPDAQAVHRCSVSKGRKKIHWEVFENIFYHAVKLAYELWPEDGEPSQDSKYLWQGMSVFGIDGSKYTLPATAQIRKEFDPESGFEYKNKGHYPQCLVSTAYDVFRRLPVARTIVAVNGSEREEAKELLQHIPPNNLLLFDRGYPSYEFIKHINENYSGYYLFRCPASETFPAVEKFLKSKEEEGIIEVAPTQRAKAKFPKHEREKLQPIKLRVTRLISPDGILSVLLTNLFDKSKFSRESIIELYFRRWAVEEYYRDEKVYLEVETFHSRNCNGIRQELFAAVIMSVIARILMVLSSNGEVSQGVEPQFKNAVITIAAEAVVLTPDRPEKAARIFREVLEEIRRVKYYRPKKPRPSKPRVTKRAKNKWIKGRSGKLNNA
ncbi:MAG: IS4 family transposase [Candidatus Omnitrophica bacterium]|nr:IS4 family transposase [Candidatus Omnitrophota bacterium]